MRNLFTLFVSLLFLAGGLTAQNKMLMTPKGVSDVHHLNKHKPVTPKIEHKFLDKLHKMTTERDLTVNFPLDYDQEDRDYSDATVGSIMETFIWQLNSSYAHTDTLTLTRALVFFDTIPNGSAGNDEFYPLNNTTLTIDSMDIWVSHVNYSGITDSIKIRIMDITGLSIVGKDVIGTTLWTTTLTTDTSITPSGFIRALTIHPNLSLNKGQAFVVKVDYIGPQIDTFFVVASQRDDCFQTCFSENSVIPNNSFYYLNFITGTGNDLSGFGGVGADCSGDGIIGTPGACEIFGPQNFFFFPYVTADVDIWAKVRADTTVGCENDVINLDVDIAGALAPVTYSWAPTMGLSDPTSPTPQAVIGLNDVTYVVTVTDVHGHSTTSSISLDSRAVNVTIPSASIPCGGTVNLTAAVTGNNVGIQYEWNDGGTNFINNVDAAGTYSITVSNNSGCSDDASVTVDLAGVSNNELDITYPPNPAGPNTYCAMIQLNFTNASERTSGWSFTWEYGDGNITSGLGGLNTYTNPGNYDIKLTADSSSCSFSNTFDISILDETNSACLVGIEDLDFSKFVSVNPNPATEQLNIDILGTYNGLQLELFDIKGQLIFEKLYPGTINSTIESIDVSKLPQGTYLIELKSEEGIATKKFMIAR